MWQIAVSGLTVAVFAASLCLKMIGVSSTNLGGPSELLLFAASIFISTFVVVGILTGVVGRRCMLIVLGALAGFNLFQFSSGISTCQCFGGFISSVKFSLAVNLILIVSWLTVRIPSLNWKSITSLIAVGCLAGSLTSLGFQSIPHVQTPLATADALIGQALQIEGDDFGSIRHASPSRVILYRANCNGCVQFAAQLEARGRVELPTLVYVISIDMMPNDRIAKLSDVGVGVRHASAKIRNKYAALFSPLVLHVDDGVVKASSIPW